MALEIFTPYKKQRDFVVLEYWFFQFYIIFEWETFFSRKVSTIMMNASELWIVKMLFFLK